MTSIRPASPTTSPIISPITSLWASAVLLAALGLPAQAAAPQQMAAAMADFQQATQGREAAIEPAAAKWRALSDAEPGNPLLRAYAGSATTMLANTTLLPWRKMGHVEDGLAMIDKALAQLTPAHDAPAPDGVALGLEARFVAASTFLALPSMFKRHDRGERLLAEVLQHPALDAAPLSFKASVWMRAGQQAAQAKRADEARQWLQKAASSGTPLAAAAQARLKEL